MSIDFSSTSGIDSLISKYMQIERQPVVTLEKRRSDLNVEKAIYVDVENHFKALYKRVEALLEEKDSIFMGRSITSTDDKVVTASAGIEALLSNHRIFVERLATSDRIVSDRLETSGVTLGQSTGIKSFTLKVGEDTEKSIEISIEEGDTDRIILEKIAEAINNSGLKVKASVVSEVDGYSRLVITSEETGSANAIQLTDDHGLLTNAGINSSVLAGETTGGYLRSRDELDARFILDGLTFVRPNNTVNDAITGIELRLLQSQSIGESEVKLEVSQNMEGAKKRVQDILDEYNRVLGYLREKTRVDGDTYYRGPLANETTIRGFITQMRYLTQDRIEESPFKRLEAIGITTDETGKLTISNESKFREAVKSDSEGVEALFTSEKGFVVKLRDLLDPMINGEGNYVSRKKETMNSTIKSIDDRIKSYEKRLAMKEESLRREFSSMLSALTMLQQQQATLSSFMSSNFFGQF